MDDLRQVLHQAVEPVEPPAGGLERVRHSVKQRRLRQRISAGVVGLTFAVGAISYAILALREGPIDRPGPAAALVPTWTAEVRDPAVAYPNVVQDDDQVYVATAEGALAFPKACDDPCTPIWQADLLGVKATSQFGSRTFFALGEGVVAISVEGHLAVFATDCRADGGKCEPLWTAEPPDGGTGYSVPAISDGIVKVAAGTGSVPKHYVTAVGFEANCRSDGGVCKPAWTGDLGVGTEYYPALAVDGVFYQQVGRSFLGFAAHCRSDGGLCEPDFEIPARGNQSTGVGHLYGPADIGGELVFVSGSGNIYAYAEHCGAACSPLWMAPVGGFLDTFPVSAGNVALVQARSGIVAFAAGCRTDGGACEPRWTFALDSYTPIAYADERVVIAWDRSPEGGAGVVALDTACEGECVPLWAARTKGEPRAVASDGRMVFVALAGGEILGYPVGCSNPCAPKWQARVAGDVMSLLIDGARLIVVAPSEVPGLTASLTLHAFAIPGGS
jgi:hypothetical protein